MVCSVVALNSDNLLVCCFPELAGPEVFSAQLGMRSLILIFLIIILHWSVVNLSIAIHIIAAGVS